MDLHHALQERIRVLHDIVREFGWYRYRYEITSKQSASNQHRSSSIERMNPFWR